MFTALDINNTNNLNSFLSSLLLPVMETYKYRKEVKAFLRYTAARVKRLPNKTKLKGTKSK